MSIPAEPVDDRTTNHPNTTTNTRGDLKVPQKSSDTALPHTCPTCGARWAGLNTNHCTSCHNTFTGIAAFDKHRTGKHDNDTRHCLNPATVGLIDAGRNYQCWGHETTDPRWVSK